MRKIVKAHTPSAQVIVPAYADGAFCYKSNQVNFCFKFVGARAVAGRQINEHITRYVEAYPNIDLEIEKHAAGYQKRIIVKNRLNPGSISLCFDRVPAGLSLPVELGRKGNPGAIVSHDWQQNTLEIRLPERECVIDPSYNGSSTDGIAYGTATTYSSAHDNCTEATTSDTELYVGQSHQHDEPDSTYFVYRAYIGFSTSIPEYATISAAKLYLYLTDNGIDSGQWGLVLCRVAWGRFLNCNDYNASSDGNTTIKTLAGDISPVYEIEHALNSAELDWLRDHRDTVQFALRSSDDINGNEPPYDDDSYVKFGSGNHGSYKPVLEVTYSTSAPSVETNAATDLTTNGATGNGAISDGGAAISAHGVIWKQGSDPVNLGGADGSTDEGSLSINYSDTFSSVITGLEPNTVYYYRAYATNAKGTTYGDAVQFTTAHDVPTVTTQAVDGIEHNEATGHGTVTSNEGLSITQHGFIWKKDSDPIDLAHADGYTEQGAIGETSFSGSLSPLSEGSAYYVRAYATNSDGAGYGGLEIFDTWFNKTVTDEGGGDDSLVGVTASVPVNDAGAGGEVLYPTGDVVPPVLDSGTGSDGVIHIDWVPQLGIDVEYPAVPDIEHSTEE